MPRKSVPEKMEEPAPGLEEEVVPDIVELPILAGPVTPLATGIPVRKALGVKEVIPFRWKLIGASSGLLLTLFKAIEREDVEAQYERAKRDGFYTDLQIVDADFKIEQSKAAKSMMAAKLEQKNLSVKHGKHQAKPPAKQPADDKRAAAIAAAQKRASIEKRPAVEKHRAEEIRTPIKAKKAAKAAKSAPKTASVKKIGKKNSAPIKASAPSAHPKKAAKKK